MAGHSDEKLKVGINALGFIAEPSKAVLEAFYPAYVEVFGPIGQRLGWSPLNFSRFQSSCADTGALIIGGPAELQQKITIINRMLGGIPPIDIADEPWLDGARPATKSLPVVFPSSSQISQYWGAWQARMTSGRHRFTAG